MKLELTGYEYEQRVWRLRSPKCPWLTKSKNKDLKIKHLKKSKKRVIISKDAIFTLGSRFRDALSFRHIHGGNGVVASLLLVPALRHGADFGFSA